jgi:hypothetical protein
MEFETYEYKIPTWAICALEYGDYSGLDDNDIKAVESFIADLPGSGHYAWPDDIDPEKYFSHSNDFGTLASDVVDVEYLVPIA